MKPPKQAKEAPREIPVAKEPDLNGLFTQAPENKEVTQATVNEAKEKNTVKRESQFLEADAKDIEQIIEKETTGKMTSNELFYEVFDNVEEGKPVRKFQTAIGGVLKCAQVQGNLEVVGQPFPEHNSAKFIYTVTVKDTVKNISVYGQGQAAKMQDNIIAPYAQAIALTVAMRNGYDKLIYPEIKQQVLHEWYIAKFGKEKDMSSILVVGAEALKDISKFIKK
jgi:hypothetical protein